MLLLLLLLLLLCDREGKEFCEHFAEIFTVMDPRDFADVFSVGMGVLYDAMCADPDALTVAAHLVHSNSVGRTFNALLAEYLTTHKLQLLADPANKVCRRPHTRLSRANSLRSIPLLCCVTMPYNACSLTSPFLC